MNPNDIEQAEQSAPEPPFDEAAIRAEMEMTEAGEGADTEEKAALWKYIRRRAHAESEYERLKANTESMLKQAKARIDGIDYVYGKFAEDVCKRLLAGSKIKSIKTPWGKAGFRTIAPKVDVADRDKFLMLAPPSLIKVVPEQKEPDKKAITEYFKATGEAPAGCEIIDGYEKFYAG